MTDANNTQTTTKREPAKDLVTHAAKSINLEPAEHEVELTNAVASPPPVGARRSGKDSVDQPEGIPTPISPPSGSIPLPPSDEAVKEHQLSGYRATALQGMSPGESVAGFEARQAEERAAYEDQQKAAQKQSVKLAANRAKMQEQMSS